MIKITILLLLISTLSFAFKVEVVGDKNSVSYMKDGKKVLQPFENKKLKPIKNMLIKPFKNKILKPYNPKLAKKIALEEEKAKKIATIKKEAVKKQFATKVDLKPVEKVKKEDIKIDKEATEFFDTLNSEENKPVNIE